MAAIKFACISPHPPIIAQDGRRPGLLLPGIEGVDSAEQQLASALTKPCEPISLRRFEVRRLR
ncbi:MAG: hypothetical protein IIA91_02585 [Chloroflexi bacterium]|nr:hypothetical protein [Chloroflexota bacterium]